MKFKLFFIISFLTLCCICIHAQTYYAKKNGKVKMDSANSTMIGKVKDHHATGIWRAYRTSLGKKYLFSETNYVNGLANGTVTYYNENGTVSETGSYKSGMKDGKWINYNENGTVRSFINYRNDTLDGLEEGYYDNGTIAVRYVRVNGELTLHELYSENGVLITGKYYKNGKADGRWVVNKHPDKFDSTLIFYTDYKDGKKNGSLQAINGNGHRYISHYVNDTLEGPYISYINDTVVYSVGNYADGKMIGAWKTNYPYGQILFSYYSSEGSLDSTYLYWHNGNIETITQTLDARMKKVRVTNFDEYNNFTKLSEGIRIDNKADSTWNYYYMGGELWSKEFYRSGFANGVYTGYYQNGKTMFTVNCVGGSADTALVFYDQKGKIASSHTATATTLLKPFFFPNGDVHLARFSVSVPNVDEKTDSVYVNPDQAPEFPGGNDEMMKWLRLHLKYPPAAKDMGLQGTVYVRFVVEKDGTISNAEIVKKVHPYLDKEALRVVLLMPEWKPGMMNGKAVRVSFTLPVRFVLM